MKVLATCRGYAGIHHLGFMVDDVDEICQRLDAAGATPMTGRTDVRHAATSGARSYYKIKYRGPDNQEFDVTESGWIGTWVAAGRSAEQGPSGETWIFSAPTCLAVSTIGRR
jgi:catechol 2,3-dioxygenase-like lactoylglutathione lyase family enzyme